MGQVLQADRIGTLSHLAGVISLTASVLTIGGQQYVTGALSRTITSDVTLTADNIYMIYAVISGGVIVLRISANPNSVGPVGFTGWKMVGAFWTDNTAAFKILSNEYQTPNTTRTITSGSGTYTVPPRAKAVRSQIVGGGGGGGAQSADGGAGGGTTFGTQTANGGGGGGPGGNFGVGGTSTGGDINLQGGSGCGAGGGSAGIGGSSFFGGAGGGASGTVFGANNGGPGAANTGGGGGGATPTQDRCGGGAGGYSDKMYNSPATSYSYGVGNGGGGGAGQGGNGGSGVIFITEFLPNTQELRTF